MPVGEPAPSLWRHRDFMLMWGGQSVSLIGAQITVLALPLLATVTLEASTFQVALLTSFGTLPWLLLSLPAGVVVDRSRKRNVMLWCDVARASCLFSLPAAALLGEISLIQLYVVAAVSGTLAVFFNSAYLSFPATMLAPARMIDANGKIGTASALAGVVGPSAAGLLVGVAGAAAAVTADALSCLVSVATLLLIRHREPRPPRRPAAERHFWRELSEGLRIIVANRSLAFITASNSLGNFLLGAINAIWVLYAVRGIGWSAQTVGLVMGTSSVGGVLGSLLAKPLIQRYGLVRVLLLSPLAFAPGQIAAAYVLPGTVGKIVVACGFAATLGSALLYNTAQRSYRMALCPAGALGRLNSTVSWLQWGLRPLAGVTGGALGTWIGLRPTVLLFAWMLPLVALILWLSPLRREFLAETPGDSPARMGGESTAATGSAVPDARDRSRPAGTAARGRRSSRTDRRPWRRPSGPEI